MLCVLGLHVVFFGTAQSDFALHCSGIGLVCLFRAEGILNRGNVDALALQESQNLSIFFATNNSITTDLKKHLEEVRLDEGNRRDTEGISCAVMWTVICVLMCMDCCFCWDCYNWFHLALLVCHLVCGWGCAGV